MKRRLLSMIISAALILSLSACSSYSSSDTNNEQKQEDSSSKLTVLNCLYNSMEQEIAEFATNHPDIKVKEEIYENETTREINKQTFTKVLAGEGPDVFIMEVRDFPNIHKMFQSELFYDLNTLIKEDKSFKMEEYNKVVMDSGIIEGKRYVVPLSFDTSSICTTKSFLSKNGINIPEEGVSWTELSNIVKKFMGDDKNKDKYLFNLSFNFEELICSSYMKFIDFTKKESNFDSEEFISLLNIFKDIQTAVCPTEVATKSDAVNLMKKGTSGVGIWSTDLEFGQILNSFYEQYLGEEVYMIACPADKQSAGITARVKLIAGINANCKKPKEAFEFLKLLLSKDNQIPYLDISPYKSIPINIEAYKEELKYRRTEESIHTNVCKVFKMYNGGPTPDEYDLVLSPLSKEMCTQSDRFYNGITKAVINDYNVLPILSEETKAFLSGKSTAEQTAKVINDKVMLYLNE